jgi:hypothetical protein
MPDMILTKIVYQYLIPFQNVCALFANKWQNIFADLGITPSISDMKIYRCSFQNFTGHLALHHHTEARSDAWTVSGGCDSMARWVNPPPLLTVPPLPWKNGHLHHAYFFATFASYVNILSM